MMKKKLLPLSQDGDGARDREQGHWMLDWPPEAGIHFLVRGEETPRVCPLLSLQ